MASNTDKNGLDLVFEQLKDESYYKSLVKGRIAKIILGNSVIRVFEIKTKRKLIDCFKQLPIDDLLKIKSRQEYDAWHEIKIEEIYSCLKYSKGRIGNNEGLKWGHATKIFNLFIGHLVFYSLYFEQSEKLKRIGYFLHVPLDNKVFIALKQNSNLYVPERIKDLNKKDYLNIQEFIRKAASKHKLPPLYFDEHAWVN